MKALDHSPSHRIAVVKDNGNTYTGSLPHKVTDILRPVSIESPLKRKDLATTPAGSKMRATWELCANKDVAPKTITFFVDAHKVKRPREVPQKIDLTPLDGLPKNTKTDFMVQLTPERLNLWALYIEHNHRRYRDQNQTMGNISAAEAAFAAGFTIVENNLWNYCHLIAYSMGGPDGLLPRVETDYDLIGPQREFNLVVGTLEANAKMLVVEDIVKKLIRFKKIPEIWIKIKTVFVPGLESYHIADTVEYTIQDHKDNPTRQITFTFDMLSRQTITEAELCALGTVATEVFMSGGHVLTTPTRKRTVLKVKSLEPANDPETSDDSFLSTIGSEDPSSDLENLENLSLTFDYPTSPYKSPKKAIKDPVSDDTLKAKSF